MSRQEWGAGFAMVPGWLLKKEPTANAVFIYIHLAMFGTFNPGSAKYDECRPSKKTLANGDPKRGYPGTGLSESSVARAVRELLTLRAITGVEKFDPDTGAQRPTVYQLMFGSLEEEPPAQDPLSQVTPPSVMGEWGDPVTGDTPPLSLVTDNPEPKTKKPLTEKKIKTPRAGADSLPPSDNAPQPVPGDLSPETRKAINDGITAAAEVRKDHTGWSEGAIRRAVRDALNAGHPVDVVLVTLVALADPESGTRAPGRIKAYLDDKARQKADPTVAPAWTQPSIKHVEAGRQRCPQHRDYPADNCAQHRKDAEIAALEVNADRLEPSLTGPTMHAREAMALARANAIAAKTGTGKPKPKMRHEPDPQYTGPMPETLGAVAARVAAMVPGDRG